MTTADDLAWEAEQSDRHEFVGGKTFAMAGAEDRHVTVNGKKNWNLTPIPSYPIKKRNTKNRKLLKLIDFRY